VCPHFIEMESGREFDEADAECGMEFDPVPPGDQGLKKRVEVSIIDGKPILKLLA
jgi:hypothetical protein